MRNFSATVVLHRFNSALSQLIVVICLTAQVFASNPIDSLSVFARPIRVHGLLCDACGCSASGGSMGFSTIAENSFLGLRSMYQRYESNDGLYTNSPWRQEQFRTYQLWTRFRLANKLEFTGQIPLQHHTRETATGEQTRSGVGDISANVLYQLFAKENKEQKKIQRLHAGLGIKLPTGEFDEQSSNTVNPAFQLGTGSFDFTFLSEYVYEFKNYGVNTMLSYVAKTENERKYRFGNQTNFAIVGYKKMALKNWQLLPQVGFTAEVFESNFSRGSRVENTSGYVSFARAGFDLSHKGINFGVSGMLPVVQDLNNGLVKARERLSIHLNILL